KPVRRIMVRLCMSLPLARAGRAAAIVAARGGGPVVVNLVLFGLARADADVVRQRAADGGQEANRGNRLEHVLPAFHYRTDLRVLGQPVVQLGVVGVLQHVHHVGAAHALRVVDASVGVAALVELRHAVGGEHVHVLLPAELDRAGRAGLHARGLLPDRDAVRAQRALVGLVVLLADARHVEGTAGHAVAAADALVGDEVDDAVGVLHDRARLRTGLEAARVFAMHAAVLADQPLQAAALLVLVLVE